MGLIVGRQQEKPTQEKPMLSEIRDLNHRLLRNTSQPFSGESHHRRRMTGPENIGGPM